MAVGGGSRPDTGGLPVLGGRCWVDNAGLALLGPPAFPLSRSFAAGRFVALLGVAGRCWVLLRTADRRSRAFTGVAVVLRARLWRGLGRLWALLGVVGRFSVVLLDVSGRFWAAGRRRRPAGSALRRGWPSLGAPERCWVLFGRGGWFSGRLGGLCASDGLSGLGVHAGGAARGASRLYKRGAEAPRRRLCSACRQALASPQYSFSGASE